MESDEPSTPQKSKQTLENKKQEEGSVQDDDGNKTIFRNLYIPNIIQIPEDDDQKVSSRHRRDSRYKISLEDPAALKFCNTLRVGWKGRVDYALNAYNAQRLKAEATGHEIQRDPAALLNVTITTVILLAGGIYDIPIEYYLYTELYLLSIRDEFHDSPPNIENLIKHIRFIRQTNNISWENEYRDDPPPGLVISKIPNRSRIPLPVHSYSNRRAPTTKARETGGPSAIAATLPAPATTPPTPKPTPEEAAG